MAIYLANDKYAAVLTSGYTAGQNTLYVSAVPDNVPTIIVAAKGTDNETVFAVTGSTVNSLTGVTRLKGANVDLDSQTPLTCLNNEEFVNQYSGAVSTPETLKNIIYAEDGGSTDAYAISLDPAPSEYVAGMLVVFKANTANTGAATLNVNSLGAKAIKTRGRTLETGEIEAGQIVTVVYDGTDFQLVSRAPVIAGDWIPTGETWAYASATTITVPSDATAKYQKGDKIRFKQGGDYKYFYVVGVAATVLTVTGGSDYTVADAAITDNYYSKAVTPQGFPGWFNWNITASGAGSMTVTINNVVEAEFRISGSCVFYKFHIEFTTGGSANPEVKVALPVTSNQGWGGSGAGAWILDGSNSLGITRFFDESGNIVSFGKYNWAAWGIGSGRRISSANFYSI